MTHFYGTEEELKLWLAQRTEKALAEIALGKFRDISEVKRELREHAKKTTYAKV